MKRLLLLLAAVSLMAACTYNTARDALTHNAQGGHTDACGNLPGMLGDDC